MVNWKKIKISDIADVNTYSINKNFKLDTIEYIDTSSVEKGRLINTQIISVEEAPSRAKRRVKKNDILISSVRPNLEHYYFVKSCKANTVVSTGFVVVTPKEETVPYFLYCLITTNQYTQYLTQVANSHTSTYPSFNPDIIYNSSFVIPDYQEQKKISDVLSCLDAKIENLRRQNETLEAIAQTLFKYWFIDFEFPNVDGKPYKLSGGAMIPSELGEIPESWRVGKLGDIGKNIREGVKENDIKPDMSYIGLEHIPRKQIALDTWGQALDIASNKFWFNKGNILFGKLRPYFHKVGVAFTSGVCSTDILVIDSKQETYFGFLLMLLSSEQFIYYVSLASEGTRMPRTSWEYMKDYPIVIPKSLVLEDFKKLLKLLIKKMEVNISQIQTLTKTRDALLPKLMSGQLRVKE